MKKITIEEIDAMMKRHFDGEEIQIIKDTILQGFWGDSSMEFPNGETVLSNGYVTDDAHKGGHFKGRKVSQLFNNIHRKIYKDGQEIPFMMHCHDWWGDGSGSIISFNFGDHNYEIEREWAATETKPGDAPTNKNNMKNTQDNKLETGIYIPDDNRDLHSIDEWMKQPDPENAQTIVLVTELGAIEIAKEDLPGSFDFDDAQKAAAEYREGFRNATRHEAIEMYDARFKGLDNAFRAIGGEAIDEGHRWTNEVDPDPEYSSYYAFFYNGNTGGVGSGGKCFTYSVRPVSAFKK